MPLARVRAATALVFVLLGVFVWPGLFGGTFFFLPFVWIWKPRQRAVDPRTNGHGSGADPGSLGGLARSRSAKSPTISAASRSRRQR